MVAAIVFRTMKATLACALALLLSMLVSASPIHATPANAVARWNPTPEYSLYEGIVMSVANAVQGPFRHSDKWLIPWPLFKGKGSGSTTKAAAPPVTQGLHLLFHNDLDWTTTNNHTGWILIEKKQTFADAQKACAALGESVAPLPTTKQALRDFRYELQYLLFGGTLQPGELLWLSGIGNQSAVLKLQGTTPVASTKKRPDSKATDVGIIKRKAICTQTVKRNGVGNPDKSSKWQVTTAPLSPRRTTGKKTKTKKKTKSKKGSGIRSSDGNTAVIGYRDRLSFRFHALPYANPPDRFAYSTVYTPPNDGKLIDATASVPDRQCPQGSSADSENCLVMNLWTPYLPAANATPSARALKPIMVWFHGGGFNTGSGQDGTFDGGQLSSRGDVVVITPNYRLSTFGFLPVNRDENAGNYAVGDCITALKWIQKYAKTFGGDPSRVTIFGQSAGARLVEVLLGSPAASGLFHRAISQSDPLGRAGSAPLTPKGYASKRASALRALDCDGYDDDEDSGALLECLQALSTQDILDAGSKFNKLTVDGTIIVNDGQPYTGETGHVNDVPVLIGFMRDEEASLGSVPSAKQANITKALQAGDASASTIKKVLANPKLFPTNIPHSLVNLTVQVHTDTDFRCGNEALAYAAITGGHLTHGVWFYTQDQRAWQIPNYDPNNLCQSAKGKANDSSSYFFCHSGDLLPTFATPGYEFGLVPRDNLDLPWIRNQVDQWTAFARSGNPNPSHSYLRVRGYHAISGDSWPELQEGTKKIMSLGPVQKVVDLEQRGMQCRLLWPVGS